MEKTKQKQTRILKILKRFPDKRLKELTERKVFSFEGMSRIEMKNWMDCVWITLGKESATNEELTKGLREVLTLAILEVLRRRGLVYINNKGNFDKTKLKRSQFLPPLKRWVSLRILYE
jgi:hypothetical protein